MAADNHTTDHFMDHEFVDSSRLRRALTHRSSGGGSFSERLACIGDAMLGAVATELLAECRPEATAGDLTEERKALVKKEALALVFDELELHESVLIRSELSARAKAEFLEAIFGCIFLEGGYDAVRSAARAMYTDDLIDRCRNLHAQDAAAVPLNPKVQLQELVQQRWKCVPSYEVTSIGESHCPTFTATVTVPGHAEFQAQGQGRTRKDAEGNAARALLPALSRDRYHILESGFDEAVLGFPGLPTSAQFAAIRALRPATAAPRLVPRLRPAVYVMTGEAERDAVPVDLEDERPRRRPRIEA